MGESCVVVRSGKRGKRNRTKQNSNQKKSCQKSLHIASPSFDMIIVSQFPQKSNKKFSQQSESFFS
jgi:hypothetical protein